MTEQDLSKFLIKVNSKVGYGSGNQSSWTKEKDGSTTILYKSGNFKFNDNFFGGEPFAGRTVVFENSLAVWMMVYYGAVEPSADNIAEIYTELQQALKNPPKNLPLRGPYEFPHGDFLYRNRVSGNIGIFTGKENLYQKGIGVYSAQYLGGWVNQRKE